MRVRSEFGHLLLLGRAGQTIRVRDPAKGLRIRRVTCLRCGERHNAWPIKCECPPLWTCLMYHQPELCKQQQCVYCVGQVIPKRYPRLFNVRREPTKVGDGTATTSLALLAENESRFKARLATIRMNFRSGWKRRQWRDRDD
jgi:hypothetical protein